MIITKLANAIKRQDWFQVTIEIFIVVIGIFMGLQVTDWANERSNRLIADEYLTQMHGEILEIEDYLNARHKERLQINDALQKVAKEYDQSGVIAELTAPQCHSIILSHIYTNFNAVPSTINELEATGRTLIIENSAIRNIMVKYKSKMAEANEVIYNINDDKIVLVEKYPELLKAGYAEPDSNFEIYTKINNSCNAELLNTSSGFKNDLIFNAIRYAYYLISLELKLNTIKELHDLLDHELGFIHNG